MKLFHQGLIFKKVLRFMHKFLELFFYIDSRPFLKLIALAILTVTLGPIIWGAILLHLHLETKFYKNWRVRSLIKKEFTKVILCTFDQDWGSELWPQITDDKIRNYLVDKLIYPYYELHVYTDVILSLCKTDFLPLEYVYCWGIDLQNKVKHRTLLKCWKFCIENQAKAKEISTVYNSYFNLAGHYLEGLGVTRDYKKAIKYFSKSIELGNDSDEIISIIFEKANRQVEWDEFSNLIIEKAS